MVNNTLALHYCLLSSCVLFSLSDGFYNSSKHRIFAEQWAKIKKSNWPLERVIKLTRVAYTNIIATTPYWTSSFAFIGAWIEAIVRNVVYVLRVLSIEIPMHSWKFLLFKGDALELTHSFFPCEEASVIECETALMFKLNNFLLQ